MKLQTTFKIQFFLNIRMGKGMAQGMVEYRYMGWNFYSEGTYLAND